MTVAPGSSTGTLVHCIDVFSTILELAGIDEAAVPGLDGLTATPTASLSGASGQIRVDGPYGYLTSELGGTSVVDLR
mgnify:CR=1 FL=1